MRKNRVTLAINALAKYLLGFAVVAVLLFVPAGTLYYPNGWLFIALLFVPMFFLGIILLVKSPDLLKKRLEAKEKRAAQSKVVALSGIAFAVSFMMAGIDYRFSITSVPKTTVVIAAVIMLVSYAMYAEVMRENIYLSRTIEVQYKQKVIDTGMYGVIRHPMYMSTVLLFISMTLVLGSFISFVIMLVYPLVIIVRIKDEEYLLEKELQGYTEYKNKVKYRLIPFIW